MQLGRYGDIINILPIARRIAERWGVPSLMVSHDFADLLDGVSYVKPHVVAFDYAELNRCLEIARRTYPCVLQCQAYGNGVNLVRQSQTFNIEHWRLAGFDKFFSDTTMLPVFDRRNRVAERKLVEKVRDGRPLLLVKFTGAKSVPFAHGELTQQLITRNFGRKHQVLDLSTIKADHPYDLLGLMDVADLLVTVDTMPLHLAAASAVPVVALVGNDAWVSTQPRCNWVAKFRYAEAAVNPMGLLGRIEKFLLERPERVIPNMPLNPPPIRRIFHCCERHEGPPDARKDAAWRSWDTLYEQGVTPCHYWKHQRDARAIGDKRSLPYLKDVLGMAMQRADAEDVICFTNDDVVLHPKLIPHLRAHVAIFEACSAQRCDFANGDMPSLNESPDVFAEKGARHMGRDLFAFTKSWLEQHWSDIGDFILGASDWDLALAELIRLDHGIVSTRPSIEEIIHPAELRRGYVAHTLHESAWVRPDNVRSAPSQKHNRALHRAWAAKHLPGLRFSAFGEI